MAEKLLFILLNTEIENPASVGTPFFQATVAASMEYEVEMVFTGAAGKLAKRGVAESILLHGDTGRSLYDLIREAYEAGVVLKVCAPARELWGDDMIPEVQETVAGGYLIAEVMSERTVTLTY